MTPRAQAPSLDEPPSLSSRLDEPQNASQTREVIDFLTQNQLAPTFRVATAPFLLSQDLFLQIEKLGPALQKFYSAQNRCYFESVKGTLPHWIADYLDQGKPEQIIEIGRMNRFRNQIPGIIRPDIILTSEGMILSELDSVPGGFGLTHLLNRAYSKIGYAPVGGPDGMTGGFRHLIRDLTADAASPSEIRLALVISRESSDYFDEMKAFARELNGPGFSVIACHPEELHYTEDGVYRKEEEELLPLGSVYRFLELFDYKNIPKMDLLLYSSRKRKVAVTPPFKAYLEEKLWFALFHHPVLKGFWEAALGEETHAFLSSRIPRTWILDPRPLPPHGIIPGLTFRGKPVTRFEELREAGQSERTYVIKPSGFSDLAWGARGVSIGPDLSREEWSARLDSALGNFSATPSLLQEYHPARRVEIGFLDSVSDVVKHLSGRARLCPYYFTSREETVLGGVLATICPADKKIIHGMSDAVMAPCRLA